MKRSLTLLALSSLLLASCDWNYRTPEDPALQAPAAPVAGQALDMQKVPAQLESAGKQLNALLDPSNPDLDPDLKALLVLMGPGGAQPLNLQPTALGRQLAQRFAAQARGTVSAQAITTVQEKLPTGTVTYKANGEIQTDKAPANGYVLIDEKLNLRVDVQWKVSGAATTWLDAGIRYNPGTGQMVNVQQEVPTNASGTVSRSGKTVAGAAFAMTPGDCLNLLGPETLTFSAWAGRMVNPPAQVSVNYAWTAQNISLDARARYATTKQQAAASVKLDVRGATAGRCTPSTFAFTPTRADLNASAEVPSHKLDLTLALRDLSNLEFSQKALGVERPFEKVGGTVNAKVSFNGQNMLTAFGPLADGSDMNLQPGDQVQVKYVQQGQLVETDLPGALDKLGKLFMPY